MSLSIDVAPLSASPLSPKGQSILLACDRDRLDRAMADRLFAQIDRWGAANALVDDDCKANILVDLASIELLDSTGLAVLLAARDRAQKSGSHFFLCSLQPAVRLVLEITNLEREFVIFPSRQAFLDLVTRRQPALVAL